MRTEYILLGLLLSLLAVSPLFAATMELEQSGADSGTVMKGQYFTLTVSGLSGSGSVSLIDTPSGFSSNEGTTKSFSEGTDSVTWTTTKISLTQSSITIKASVSVEGSPTIAESDAFDVVMPPSISFEATPSSVAVNEDSDYTVTFNVQNLGGTSAQSVAFSVSGSGMAASCPTISSIAPGASSSTQCDVTASTAGTITATFTAEPSNCDDKTDLVSVVVTATGGNNNNNPPGGGSTGMAGSAGIVSQWVKEIKLSDSELNLGQTLKQIKSNYRILFNFRGLGHTVSVLNVTTTTATVEVASTPQVATLSIGQSKQFDVDGDGYYDIYLSLDSIDSGVADLTLRAINEKVPSGSTSTSSGEDVGGDNVNSENPPVSCNNGALRCSGSELQECIDGSWAKRETCANGCDEQTNSCRVASPTTQNPPQSSDTPMALALALVLVIIFAVGVIIYKLMKKPKARAYYQLPPSLDRGKK